MEAWRRQRAAFAKTASQQSSHMPRTRTPLLSARSHTYSSGSGAIGRSRSSVRRRECYGSPELHVTGDPATRLRSVARFRLEPRPDPQTNEEEIPSSPVLLENPQTEIRWYFRYFLGNEHRTVAGVEPESRTPFFLSILAQEDPEPLLLKIRAILWLKTGPKKLYMVMPDTGSRSLLAKAVLQKYPGMCDYNRALKEITNPKIQKDLAMLEDQEGSVNFKFGVVFRRHGQTTDDQMLSNVDGNSNWEMFLRILGQKVELKGWGSYKGGLDTTTDSTGPTSLYTRFAGHELMFHVSTLLPFSDVNPQQVERKRHIGNDIVNIVFESGGDPRHPSFSPSMMRSQFTHVFAVVTLEEGPGTWRLWILSEESVPAYGPLLPHPPTFSHPQALREFILTKLINGERAAFGAAAFTEKRERTTDSIMKDMYLEYMGGGGKGGGLGQKVSKTWLRSSSRARLETQDARRQFLRLGELVKLERLLSGDVPDYSDAAQAALCRQQPWEPQLLVPDLPARPAGASDSWGTDRVLLAPKDGGLGLVAPATPWLLLAQPDTTFAQIDVVESFGLLFALCDPGKDSWLTIVSLGALSTAMSTGRPLTRKELLVSRVASTKGLSVYALSDAAQLRLSVGVVTGRRVSILRWALGPLGKLQPGLDLSHNLTPLADVALDEEPLCLSLFETGATGTLRAALASNHSLCLANFSTGITTLVHRHHPDKGKVKSVQANWDVEGLEIVLSYENTTLIFDPNAMAETLEILWTSTPKKIAYRFPFMLGFTGDTMEVRLGVNGNLLATSYIPNLQLLASKGDVFFGAEQTGKDASGASGGKRWGVYRITAAALSGEGVGAKAAVSKTPQPQRAGRRKAGGSTGSDSGVGGGRNSSSSSEGVCFPHSPLAHVPDPFDIPASPLAK